ncbi:MAG: tRNA-intron lyase [Candidatus Aenigmarchaeota archaeon]|nr:tRNA-intron lyase [Candidatus Aenigmarchaeota archaeon]
MTAETAWEGEIIENRIVVTGEDAVRLYDDHGYGKPVPEENPKRVELDLVEAAYLVQKEKLNVYEKGEAKKKKLSIEDLMRLGAKAVNEFHPQFIVLSDLRERGYLVKTGFKFGAHFRVYERGVKLKRGPKAEHEHTKWVVHAVAEESAFSLPELSRAVRLAHNIRATFIWAVVDKESDVTYYNIQRLTP